MHCLCLSELTGITIPASTAIASEDHGKSGSPLDSKVVALLLWMEFVRLETADCGLGALALETLSSKNEE